MDIGTSTFYEQVNQLFVDKTGYHLDIPSVIELVDKEWIWFKSKKITFSKEINIAKAEISETINSQIQIV